MSDEVLQRTDLKAGQLAVAQDTHCDDELIRTEPVLAMNNKGSRLRFCWSRRPEVEALPGAATLQAIVQALQRLHLAPNPSTSASNRLHHPVDLKRVAVMPLTTAVDDAYVSGDGSNSASAQA